MPLLILATERDWTTGTRLLMMVGSELARRGETVVVACAKGSGTERALHTDFPALERRALPAAPGVRRLVALRKLVRAVGCTAALVHGERDALGAANVLGRRGTVLLRVGVGERVPARWRMRVAAFRARIRLLQDQTSETSAGATARSDAAPSIRAPFAWPSAGDPRGPSLRVAPMIPPPVIAIVAGTTPPSRRLAGRRSAEHIAGAAALRAVAKLVPRYPDLRVSLVGETHAMQQLRLHGGSLGLADRVQLVPTHVLLDPGPFAGAIVWVAAHGDCGAAAIVAAMSRRLPVIVPRGFDIEPMVAQRITGYVADETDLSGSTSALAHMLSDAAEYHAMGAASAARADRVHNWEAYVNRVHDAVGRAAGNVSRRRTPSGAPG